MMRAKPYLHCIVIIESDGKDYAYHYSSKDYSKVSAHRDALYKSIEGSEMLFGMHMLKTDELSFESVRKMDPYFKNMVVTDDIGEFSEKYKYYIKHLDLRIGI